jgi:hypothetical protein
LDQGADDYAAWAEALRRIAVGQRAAALIALEGHLHADCPHPLFWFTASQLLIEAGRIEEARRCFVRVIDGLEMFEGGHHPGLELRWALILWGRHLMNRNAFPDAGWFLRQICRIPERPPSASPNRIDLTAHFNGTLDFAWTRRASTHFDFRQLPRGIVSMGGVEFDVRGVVVMASTRLPAMVSDSQRSRSYLSAYGGPDFESALDPRRPKSIEDLPVQVAVRRIHILMTSEGGGRSGKPIATLRVLKTDGEHHEQSIRHGVEARDWLTDKHGAIGSPEPIWVGDTHTASRLRLYRFTWENPYPEIPVDTLTLESTGSDTTPIIFAITVEPL